MAKAKAPKKASKKSCWAGYEKRGMKMKGGKAVNNCVKKDPQEDDDCNNRRRQPSKPIRY